MMIEEECHSAIACTGMTQGPGRASRSAPTRLTATHKSKYMHGARTSPVPCGAQSETIPPHRITNKSLLPPALGWI
jgi:hypothetical protein